MILIDTFIKTKNNENGLGVVDPDFRAHLQEN